MTLYRVFGVSSGGISGWQTIEAANESQAIQRVVADGYTALEVRQGKLTLLDWLDQPIRLSQRLGGGEQALILTQLAMLVRAGLPIDRSLDLLSEQSPRVGQREILHRALVRVRAGAGLARSFDDAGAFPGYVIGVLRSAERSGNLAEALRSLAERMTRAAATRRQLITALTYPVAVLVATLMALLLVLTVVVPQFEPVFGGEEARLPALTQGVLFLSGLALNHGIAILACFTSLPLLLVLAARTDQGLRFVHRHGNKIPGLRLHDQLLAAGVIGILGTLLANGLSVIAALPLTREAVHSRRWRKYLEDVERLVREGASLSYGLSRDTLVPGTAIRLIEVGERGGRLASTCLEASEILGTAAQARVDRLLSLANPVAIMVLGGVIGLLVAGVMLGIFALGDFAG